jgi:NTP pyrophosphatase (non-canonical NTP hydrolase)
MPVLPENPQLSDFQVYVRKLEEERGFVDTSLNQACLLLGEEVGELFKAVRKSSNMSIDSSSTVGSVDEELADVFIFLLSIANRTGISLEEAFRSKELINHRRVWEKSQ